MSNYVGPVPVWPNYTASNVTAASANAGSDLGKNDFFKILIAQLSHQDPMQPMEDRDFIAQMAQFSSLEQMMNMTNELQMLRNSAAVSSSLIDRTVSWHEVTNIGELEVRTGVVDAIVFKDGIQLVKVGSNYVPIEELLEISNGVNKPDDIEEPNEEVNNFEE